MVREMKKGIKIVLLSLMMVVMLAACGSNQTGTTENNKEFKAVVTNASNSLNSLITSESVNVAIVKNIGEGLVRENIHNEIEGGIAEKWDISEDGLVYTFYLRDAKWQNGTAVTAADFEFAWKKVATLADSEYKHLVNYFANGYAVAKEGMAVEELGVKALDDKTLQVTLEKPIPYILEVLSGSTFLPVQESFYNEVTEEQYGTTIDTIQSNGPFILEKYEGEVGYTFKKNENYWDAKNVQMETVDIRVVKSLETQSIMYDNAEIDKLILTDTLIDKYANNPDLQLQKSNQLEYIYLSGTTLTPSKLLSNDNFRKAVAYAIDKSVLTETLLKDGSLPADYLIPSGFVELDGKDYREVSGAYNNLKFDLSTATKSLEAAKAELGDTPLNFTLTFPDSSISKKILENLASQIETNLPGVTVTQEVLPTQIFYPTLDEFKTVAARSSWSASVEDPTSYFNLFKSDSDLNSGRYTNAAYDALLGKMDQPEMTKDKAKRWNVFFEAEKTILEDNVIIPLYQKGNKVLVQNGAQNISYDNGEEVTHYRLITKKA